MKEGRYRDALNAFTQYPEQNLPNIAGLLPVYPAARVKLEEMREKIVDDMEPPRVTAAVELLIRINSVLGDYDDTRALFDAWSGFDGPERAQIHGLIWEQLVKGGYFEEALAMEAVPKGQVERFRNLYREHAGGEGDFDMRVLYDETVVVYIASLGNTGRISDAMAQLKSWSEVTGFEPTSSEGCGLVEDIRQLSEEGVWGKIAAGLGLEQEVCLESRTELPESSH